MTSCRRATRCWPNWRRGPGRGGVRSGGRAARAVLPALKGTTYGLTFLDAVKADYPAYFEHALSLLADGGLLVADNALLGGEGAPGGPEGYWSAGDRGGGRRYNPTAFRPPRA